MKLYLARHGRTNYNDLDRCNSDPNVDVHLTELGVEQSKHLTAQLKQIAVDCIFVSEMPRTQQTAAIVNESRKLPIHIEPRLDDVMTGYEGKPFRDYMAELEATPDKWTARLQGGESIEDMKQRVAAFITDLRAQPYDAVLVITSEWVIFAILALIKELSNDDAWHQKVVQGEYIALDLAKQLG